MRARPPIQTFIPPCSRALPAREVSWGGSPARRRYWPPGLGRCARCDSQPCALAQRIYLGIEVRNDLSGTHVAQYRANLHDAPGRLVQFAIKSDDEFLHVDCSAGNAYGTVARP